MVASCLFGAEVGPQVPVHAVTPDGKAHSLPAISLSRGAGRLVVRSDGKLMAVRGEVGRGALVEIDFHAERTHAGPLRRRLRVRDFDVAPDGREVIFDRLVDDSDLVLIDR